MASTRLQGLLDAKERQLTLAGTLGQRVLAQQMELEERVRQLQESGEDDDQVDELEHLVQSWETECEELINGDGGWGKQVQVNGHPVSPPQAQAESSQTQRPAAPNASQSRRQKNAAHRQDDVEFAFEIGSNLLTEVRRLQALIGERDKAIQDLNEEKDDLEKSIEGLRAALKQQEASADKYREENWNLEVTCQELKTQLSEIQSDKAQLNLEVKKLNKALANQTSLQESTQSSLQQTQSTLDDLRAKHELDTAQWRKANAANQRERQDLQNNVEQLKLEVERSKRRLPKFGSPLTPQSQNKGPDGDKLAPGTEHGEFATPYNGDDGERDPFASGHPTGTNRRRTGTALDPTLFPGAYDISDMSPEPSPSKSRDATIAFGAGGEETEEMKRKVASLQRTVGGLRNALERERVKRVEMARRLRSAGMGAEDGEDLEVEDLGGEDEAFEDEQEGDEFDEEHGAMPSVSAGAGGARRRQFPVGARRGRGGRGMSLVQRLSMVHRGESEEPESPVKDDDDPDTSRASVDSQGLDPFFSKSTKDSPLRKSTLGRSMRGRAAVRGGAGRGRGQGQVGGERPDSLVGLGVGGDLARELGISEGEEEDEAQAQAETMDEEEAAEEAPAKEYGEMEVQTADDVVVLPRWTFEEMQAQIASPPVPPPAPVSMKSDGHSQTDSPVKTVKGEAGVQASFAEPHPTPVDAKRTTLMQSDSSSAATTPTRKDFGSGSLPSSQSSTLTQTQRTFLASLRPGDETDDGEETETGAETETETEGEYEDALERATLPSAGSRSEFRMHRRGDTGESTSTGGETESEDFHSVLTVTDNEYEDGDSDEDERAMPLPPVMTRMESNASSRSVYESAAESFATGRHPRERVDTIKGPAGVNGRERRVSGYKVPQTQALPPPPPTPKREMVEMGVSPPPSPAAPPPPPKRETKDNGMQTDPLPLPPAQQEKKHHQFQFIPPVPMSASSGKDRFDTIPRSRTSTSERDRRQSIESAISSIYANANEVSADDITPKVHNNVPGAMDTVKSRPPTMTLPPPPKAPPPSGMMGSMPPPSFIPDHARRHHDGPPGRPSSPPPIELIQRATTPNLYGKSRMASGGSGHGSVRQQGHGDGLKTLPSNSSFRSDAGRAAMYLSQADGVASRSQASLVSAASPRSSLSSRPEMPTTPSRMGSMLPKNAPRGGTGTDPSVIHAITQTMIGEFLYKYTRKPTFKGSIGRKSLGGMGGGVQNGERRHRRFFWVHPYTKTLYWSEGDPGSVGGEGGSAKSAYIEGVRSVLDPNPMPPGLHSYSVVVSTPQREMKITAPTKERHDIWLNALKYLLSRPAPGQVGTQTLDGGSNPASIPIPQSPMSMNSDYPLSDENHAHRGMASLNASPQSQRSRSSRPMDTSWNTTPKGQRSRSQISLGPGGSIGKRSGTPAMEYLRYGSGGGPESPYSPSRSFVDVDFHGAHDDMDDDQLDFELEEDADGFEGMENVRACCDGKHTVGRHHHHHHHHDHPMEEPVSPSAGRSRHLSGGSSRSGTGTGAGRIDPHARPSSPAWSFRSKTGSMASSDGGGGLFGGRLKFGSKRSARAPVNVES